MYSCHLGSLGLDTELVEIHCSDFDQCASNLKANEWPVFPRVLDVYIR